MTKERIEDMREVVLPFVSKRLKETNYEGLGESDAEEFDREFNEILNLAIKALEQESVLDKIKAEIENDWQLKKSPCSPFSCGLRRAIEIIDKYKAESEDIYEN